MNIIRGILKRFPTAGFARNVLILAGGTALAQGMAVLVSPILSRLYTPSEFGVLAVFTSIISIFGVAVTFRYEMAIPLPNQTEEAAEVLALCLVITSIVSAVAGLAVVTFGDALVVWLHAPTLRGYLWLLPATVLGLGVYQSFSYWATRRKAFALIAQTKLLQQFFGQILVSIPLGVLKLGSLGLLLGYSFTQVAGAWSFLRLIPNRDSMRRFRPKQLWQVAVRYRNFPFFTMCAGLVNMIGVQIPVVALTTFFSTATVGHYSLAFRILLVPVTLVGQAVSQVFYQMAVETRGSSSLQRLTEQLAVTLFTLGLPVLGMVGAVGPKLFTTVLGSQWLRAGEFAQWLSPWFLLLLISSPLSVISLAKEKQAVALLISIGEVCVRLAACAVGSLWLKSEAATIILLSVAGVLISGASITWMLVLVKADFISLFRRSVRPLVVCMPVLWVVWGLGRVFSGIWTTAVALVGIGSCLLVCRATISMLPVQRVPPIGGDGTT